MASNNGYLTHCRICGTPIFSLGNRQFCSACYAQNRRNAAHRSNAEAKMRREQAKREEEKMKASNKTVTSAQDFHKGDPIMVAGTLSSYSHKNKDGENRTFYTVWADKASFASRGKDTTQNSTPAPAATPASAPAPSAPTYGEYGADEFDAVEEDDLPF